MARGQRKPRLSDVAARAGVSRTTASYVLNGRAGEMRLSADTVGRVQEAVAALGYRPNSVARSLRTSSTGIVGVVSDHVASGHFASRMLTGASTAARELGHLTVIGETDGDPLLEADLVDRMLDRGVDAVVYATARHREVTVPPALLRANAVLLNCVDPEGRLPAVVPDEHGGGLTAARLLTGVPGDVVLVGDVEEQGTRAGPLRLTGVAEGLAESGRVLATTLPCAWTVDAGREAVAAWAATGGAAAALVCMNDRLAMGACQALAAAGRPVPDEVAVVSFDGSELARWLEPRVTSVRLPFAELGAAAVRRALAPGGATPGVERLGMDVEPGASVPLMAQAWGVARSAVRRNASANAVWSARGTS